MRFHKILRFYPAKNVNQLSEDKVSTVWKNACQPEINSQNISTTKR